MDLETVRICFKKYTGYLEEKEKINLPIETNTDVLSIEDMDKLTQTLFMDYVMKNSDKINQTAVPCVLYKHVNTLIRQYIQEGPKEENKPKEPEKNEKNDKNDNKENVDPNKKEVSKKKKGWLWFW